MRLKTVYALLALPPILLGGPKVTSPIPCEIQEQFSLDTTHYKKVVIVEGFPVVASAKVSDFALLEAAYLLDKMLGHQPKVLRELGRNKVRFSIMAPDEFTTDVPEHSHLKPSSYWDRRARGLGADPQSESPCVSAGEENLLGLNGDPYHTESIFVHEFAHAVHIMAMNFLDDTFDRRLKLQFQRATDAGLWKGTYAGTNHHEYFAEGVQSWFDTNRENDHDHGSIDTRAELLSYDPDLCKLIQEAYGTLDWNYVKPAVRAPASFHLTGFDLEKSPSFKWPKALIQWQKDFEQGKVSLAPEDAIEGIPMNPDSSDAEKSYSSRKRVSIYFHNLSGRSLSIEWIDFEGKPRQRSILRHRDHREPFSFVGHLWRIADAENNRPVAFYRVLNKPTRVDIHKQFVETQLNR